MNPLKQLREIIYPPRCVICGDFLWQAPFDAENMAGAVCGNCTSGFSAIAPPFCTICGIPFGSDTNENHPCEDCLRTRPRYQAASAPYRYEGPLLDAILKLKYGRKTFVADVLGPLLADFTESRFTLKEPFITMPVPLHKKRLRERGFNQSMLLAKQVATHLNGRLDPFALVRVKATIPQTKLSKEARRRNVRKAFDLKHTDRVRGKNILLVDDVSTTGNTLNECAGVLVAGGAKAVFCVTLAKAVL